MTNGTTREGKGIYGEVDLPVSRGYVYPRRRGMLRLGLALALGVLAWVAFDFFTRDARFLSGGPVSSSHAMIADDCAACHFPPESAGSSGEADEAGGESAAAPGPMEISNAKCSVCHEKHGDELGVYTFDSHYLYRSDDFQRLVPSEHEVPCSACHPEHQGRDAEITRVADTHCQTCHEFESFGDGHPQFEFAIAAAGEPAPDRAGIEFSHIQHVQEVMVEAELEDVERACLACHNPEPDGHGFEPISFDLHCDACHLTTGIGTPRLSIGAAADDEPGVRTLEQIRASGEAGTEWADYFDPNEFRQVGRRVSKSPLHHPDPWILDNLRRLRRVLYPDPGLADLLRASADVPAADLVELYQEAADTLEERIRGLRGRPEPEIQDELAALEGLLGEIRRALRDPYTPLDETEFLLALEEPDESLAPEQVEAIEDLAAQLTQPCQVCHQVNRATFVRVQTDQKTMRRAEFDHGAHVLDRRCLDCHGEIPVEDALNGAEVPAELDRAEIHNLPKIESCQECHAPRRAADSCITCHLFHPDRDRHADLLLYLD